MEKLEKIKEALQSLQQIHGVEGCWVEAEEGGIIHVYTQMHSFDYDLQGRIFQEYEKLEASFPQVSFEFRTTSLSPSPTAEAVF